MAHLAGTLVVCGQRLLQTLLEGRQVIHGLHERIISPPASRLAGQVYARPMPALEPRWSKRRAELRRGLQERGEWRLELREPLDRYVKACAVAQRLWDELQAAEGLSDTGSAGQARVRPLVAPFMDAQRNADLLGARLGSWLRRRHGRWAAPRAQRRSVPSSRRRPSSYGCSRAARNGH